jgi:D-3-phosphoglycerate dehydrogenase
LVAQESDIVSVHLALTNGTRGLCDKLFFSNMKQNAFFINTSRDEVVDEAALMEAMRSKNIRVGTDVFAGEPSSGSASWKSEFSSDTQVIGTHHIGASTDQAQDAIGDEALRIIKTFVKRGEVLNCVNIDLDTPATHMLSVRHLNRVGVLAAVLSEIQKAEINVLDMENKIFEGDEAAIAKLRLSKEPERSVVEAIKRSHSAVISASVLRAKF